MADFNKKDRHEKSENSEKEPKATQVEPKEQEDRAPKDEKKKHQPKPYVHIDTFLDTAAQLYDLSSVQKAGFKAKMLGRHYQTDEKVFLQELKEHFNIKDKEENEDK